VTRKVRVTPRNPHLWAQLGILAVGVLACFIALIGIATAAGYVPGQ
jgi:hypothetical protein